MVLFQRTPARLASLLAAGAFAASLLVAVAPATHAAEPQPVPLGTFDDGLEPWFASNIVGEPTFDDGRLCVGVPAATSNPWDTIVGLNGVAIEEGTTYGYSFEASASAPRVVRALIGENGGAYRTVIDESPALDAEPATFDYTFTPA